MSAATIASPGILSVTIDRLFDLRAQILAAEAMVIENVKDEVSLNAGRVMKQVAASAFDLIQQIDKASLAIAIDKHQPETINAESSTDQVAGKSGSLHELAMRLSCELAYLMDYIELAQEQADQGPDSKMVSLMDAAVRRMKRARKLAEKLEVGACHL